MASTTRSTRQPIPDTQRADCSVCGAEATFAFPVYRAGIVDGDGVYFPRACGGCLDDLEAEQRRIAAGTYDGHDFGADKRAAYGILIDVMPGEADDGIVTALEDFDGFGDAA